MSHPRRYYHRKTCRPYDQSRGTLTERVYIKDVGEVVSVKEAAKELGIARDTLAKRLESGRIPFFRVGHERLVALKDIERAEGREQAV